MIAQLFTMIENSRRLFRDLYDTALNLANACDLLSQTEEIRRHAEDAKAHTTRESRLLL